MSSAPSIRAHALSFAFDDRPLFTDATFHLEAGWTGLVGPNGAGKSTLLRLIRGELEPTSGHLELQPEGARVTWCEQRIDTADQSVHDFANAWDGLSRKLIGRLGLEDLPLERWDTLSPGERKRWQLGAALWSEPDVLLLDEPDNHLDEQARKLMLDGLRTFRGVGLVVSHSRTLLDALTTATLRLAHQRLTLWPMPFTEAKAQWESDRARRHEERAHTQKTLQKEERALSDQRRTLQSSSRSRSTAVRMRNQGDSEARTLGADFRAEQAEMAHAATLRRLATKAERVRGALDELEFEEEAGHDFHFEDDACPKPTVLQAPELQLLRGEHVWLRGPNGAGKTTLVRKLLAACELPPERVLVLPQELTLEEGQADLEAVRALPKEERGRVLQLVHALGVEPDQLLRSQSPSPGEARKLRLALGLGRQVWLAVLDEPTNHLDLPSVERLEAALKAFPSALLLVTHDARLGEAVCSRVVEVTASPKGTG